MENKRKNIEELFQKEFSDFKLNPSEKVWRSIDRKLKWRDFARFRLNKFNIFYTGVAVIAIGIASFTIIENKPFIRKNKPDFSSEVSSIHTKQFKSPDITYPTHSEQKAKTPIKEEINYSLLSNKNKQEKPDINLISTNSNIEKSKVDKEPENIKNPRNENQPLKNEYSSFMAYFIPSKLSGCAPLAINFSNMSVDAISYIWSFGDGGESYVKNPQYIFDEPGTYIVNLTAISENNEISTFRQTVEIFAKPEVNFKIDIQDMSEGGVPVYFYNYSSGATNFLWDFGDGGSSSEKEPSWIYNSKSNINIKLIATSNEGCIDSMILINAFEEKVPEIVIPNAFSPNIYGPNGGYYNIRDKNNDVFHPWFEETPVDFQLRIFNRKGNLIFESKDNNIGWDGYFNQSLQPQGVYIYKLKVKFANGKTVVKMGDITLFHENR